MAGGWVTPTFLSFLCPKGDLTASIMYDPASPGHGAKQRSLGVPVAHMWVLWYYETVSRFYLGSKETKRLIRSAIDKVQSANVTPGLTIRNPIFTLAAHCQSFGTLCWTEKSAFCRGPYRSTAAPRSTSSASVAAALGTLNTRRHGI